MNADPILLVEDNPDDVTFVMRAFKKNSIPNRIVVASDGEQALRVLLPEDGTPPRLSLVLLDVKLPKIDGLEVLRIVRRDPRAQTVPIVVLTTSNEERDVVASYRLGANSFVRKPMQFTEFVDATRILGLYWLWVNLPPAAPINGG
jgi:two-component system response regulator